MEGEEDEDGRMRMGGKAGIKENGGREGGPD